jgi:type IV pilus assembly protein PilC
MSLDQWLVARARVTTKKHRGVRLDDKVALFQQLATLIAAGTPLWQSLQICATQSNSIALQCALDDAAASIASGSSLRMALAQHPRIFESHWLGVIHSGETSGALPAVLKDLSEQITDYRNACRKIVGAMIYPAVLIVVATAAIVVMLTFVVPTFADMFKEMDAELPDITRVVMSMSQNVVHYGLYVAIALGVLGFAMYRWLCTELGRRYFSAAAVATPMIGRLAIDTAMYRFAAYAGLLLRSGVAMLEMLETLEEVFVKQPVYRDALRTAKRRVASGRSLADALEQSGLFTSLVINMVRTGEETGQLPGVMQQLAPYYREKAESAISSTTKLVEPAIIVVMGTAIAVLALAVYMPMFELSGNIK